jgi:hypothetical protein
LFSDAEHVCVRGSSQQVEGRSSSSALDVSAVFSSARFARLVRHAVEQRNQNRVSKPHTNGP